MSKGLEALKDLRQWVLGEYSDDIKERNAYDTIEKELKALEIIIKKHISPDDFILCYYTMNNKKWLSYEEYKKAYINYYEDDDYLLVEEEYKLLKEVLL